jgi:DNA polymerase-1
MTKGFTIPSGKLIAVDCETTGLNPWKNDRPFAFSFCNEEGETGYLRWEVDPNTRQIKIGIGFIELKKFLEDPSIAKVYHNAKFDLRMADKIGIETKGEIHDTMFAMHILRNDEPTLKLKPLAEKYVNIPIDDEEILIEATRKRRRELKGTNTMVATDETHGAEFIHADYWLAPPELCKIYAVRDAERTMTLWLLLQDKLKEEGLWDIYLEEIRLLKVTYAMEERGVRVDPVVIESEIKRNTKIVNESGERIDKICFELNPNSHKQLSKYLFQEKGYTPSLMTDAGNPSVCTEVLMSIEDPICKLIIEHKTAEKALNGFFGRFKKLMVEEKGLQILHPDFHQIGPITGRYSCREPNLQNVADPYGTRSPIPIPARMAFVPRPGYVWYHFDYKQMELWLFSSPALANEQKMFSVLLSGEDLPSSVAIEMGWGNQLEEDKRIGRGVTRVRVKLMLYGIVYGIGPMGLSLLNKIPYQEAVEDLNKFKTRYPNIDNYMQQSIREVYHRGFIKGPLGRKYQANRNTAYKIANHLVQGSAAHILKKAMIDTHDYLKRSGKDAHLIMTIHDELAFEINKRHESIELIRSLKNIMESYGKPFSIPYLPVDIERVRTNWMEKEEVEV